MKKVLITGSNGLLGQKIVKLLCSDPEYKEKYRLIATSKGDNRIHKTKGFTFRTMDIASESDVAAVFEEFQPDYLINTAAMTNVDACEEDKEGCRAANIEAVRILGENAEKYNTHFLHLSTDFIFDGEDGPYSEDDEPNPLSYYGWSKLEGEKIVQSLNCPWAIARTIIVYGIVEDMSRSNIVLWAKQALEKGEPLNIVNDQFRSPTLAEDLAKGCIQIIDNDAKGIFHLSGKELMSVVEIVRRVAKYFKLDDSMINEISSASLNQAAKRPPKTGFDLSKSRREIAYDPRSFEEGLEELSRQL